MFGWLHAKEMFLWSSKFVLMEEALEFHNLIFIGLIGIFNVNISKVLVTH